MVLKELYNMNDAYQCKSNEQALKLFKDLRNKIGTISKIYSNVDKLSDRQIITAENAIKYIKREEYCEAIREVYDFLENYRDNTHELTNPEFGVLHIILTMIEKD